MDNTALRIYGLSKYQMALVNVLRKTCYGALQIAIIVVYIIIIMFCFISHDVWIDDLSKEYYLKLEDSEEAHNKA